MSAEIAADGNFCRLLSIFPQLLVPSQLVNSKGKVIIFIPWHSFCFKPQ
jgi:hypothetical protein